jgi:3-hydroxyisobutyrate dehydrogenase
MRVAVIGTGIMGAGIAGSLAREGHEVVVWNRTAARAEATE